MVLPSATARDPLAPQASRRQYLAVAVPETRYDSLVQALREAVPAGDDPPAFAPYVAKVREHAYRVTDEDVTALKEAGYSEDEIFERTVAAAVAAGLERLEAGLRTLR